MTTLSRMHATDIRLSLHGLQVVWGDASGLRAHMVGFFTDSKFSTFENLKADAMRVEDSVSAVESYVDASVTLSLVGYP